MRMKKLMKKAITAVAAVSLTAAAIMPMNAVAAPNNSYKVTYRPGKLGAFSEEFVQRCKNAALDMEVTKLGTIKMEVPAKAKIPFPTADTVELSEEYQGRYLVNAEYPQEALDVWAETATGVKGNLDYVVDYVAMVDAVEYSANFVDAQSGESIATPVILQGNVGQTVSYQPKAIDNYALVEASGPITLTANADDNTMVFRYTYTVDPTVQTYFIPGTTTTETEIVSESVPATGGAAGENAEAGEAGEAGDAGDAAAADEDGAEATAEDGASGEDLTTIGDTDTPLSGKDGEQNVADGSDTETIEDGQVPLTGAEASAQAAAHRRQMYAWTFALFLILAAAAYYGYNRYKKAKADK